MASDGMYSYILYYMPMISITACIQVCMVDGLYVLQVRMISYSNPTGGCHECSDNHGCCDGLNSTTDSVCSGEQRCDSYFVYCLRVRYSSGSGCGSYNATRRSLTNLNDAAVDFSQSTVLGLENPLTLPGLTNAWDVSVLMNHIISLVGNDAWSVLRHEGILHGRLISICLGVNNSMRIATIFSSWIANVRMSNVLLLGSAWYYKCWKMASYISLSLLSDTRTRSI